MNLTRLLLTIFLIATVFIANAQKKPKEYNPFEGIGKKAKVLTLSNGKYVEFFDMDSIQRIGTVLFNIRQKKIVRLLNADSTFEKFSNNSSASRWYSVDPLADKFHEWSPYNFSFNNPLRFVDPDGQEPEDWIRLGKDKIIFDKNITTQEQATAKYGNNAVDLGKTYNEKGATYHSDGSAFFTNETKAYNFMWNNSNSGEGTSKETENFAFITKNGVAVLPTEGTTHDGREFKNDKNTAETGVYKTSGEGKSFTVDFNGTKLSPIALAHTHPWSSSLAWGSHSPEDQSQIRTTGLKSVVFSPRYVYMATPSDLQPTPIGTLKNFLKDGYVIIPNINKIK